MKTLVLVEFDQQQAKRASLACISAAGQLSEHIDLLCINAQHNDVKKVSQLDHISAVYHYPHDILTQEIDQLVDAIEQQYDYILAAATSTGKQVIPRIAIRRDVSPLSEVISIRDTETFQRAIYAGNALITVRSLDPIKVMTIRSTCFNLPSEGNNNATITTLTALPASVQARLLQKETSHSERPALSSANIVISGGRGFKDADQFHALLSPLATQLNAAIGASRAAVDAGYMSNDFQIGQTGQVVAPKIYFAIGISGAIQHLAGMLDSQVIIAINKDANANIHRFADYSLIGNLSLIIPELTEKLS